MGRLYLIRHGETSANAGYQLQGQFDCPLNEKGLMQAQKLAEHFKDIKVDKIYCSSLTRAVQTATPIAEVKGLELQPMDELCEIAFGEWEGKTFDEINAKWPGELDKLFTKPLECNIEGGETLEEVAARVKPVFEAALKETEEKDVVIVSHGGMIRVLLCLFLGMDLNRIWNFGVHNCSITSLIKWRDYGTVLEYFNDIHHLK